MSLILDALKKAEAERALGRAPGLQAQPMTLPPGDGEDGHGAARRPGPWIAAGATVAALVAGGTVWWVSGREAAPDAREAAVPLAAPATPAPSLPALPPSRVPASAPPPVAAATPSPAPSPLTPNPATTAGGSDPTPQVKAPESSMHDERSATTETAKAGARGTQARARPTPDAASSRRLPAPEVPPLESLPEDIRRTLPAIVIGGSIYADMPGDRILVVNGHLLREGDTVDGSLVLEGIGRQSATWRLGEQRFSTKF